MANVKFDNFRWSSNQDPHWDEWHLTVELPITDPSTGNNVIASNVPRFEMQSPFDAQTFAAYEDLRTTDPDAYVQLPYGIDSMTFKLFFDYTDSNDQSQTWEMPKLIDMTAYTEGYWFLARYTKISVLHPELDPHALHVDYFDYLIGSNLDLILEQQYAEGEETIEEFLPVVILMQDKQWYDWPQGTNNPLTNEPGDWTDYPKTDLHRTTDRILKKLAMKGADIKEAFLEQEADDSNTDNAAEKWDFMLHFAAPLYTGNSATAQYLHEFFLRLMDFTEYSYEDYQAYLSTTNPNWPYYWYIPVAGSFAGDKKYYKAAQPVTNMHITEGSLTGYDVTYGWSYIFERIFPGQFHDDRDAGYLNQGHEEPLMPGQASIQMYERQESNEFLYRKGLDEMHENPGILLGRSDEGYHDYIIITRQFGDFDENGVPVNMYYSRILIMALSQQYKINITDYTSAPNYQFRYADIDLFDKDATYKPLQAFRIPLSIQGLQAISALKREEVIADSLCYTVFLVHKEKVAWYESGFFKIFIVVVAIILIVVVAYYGLGDIAAGLATAIFGAGASPLLVYITYVVLAFALGQIISMAGQAIGGIWGQAFMIIAAIYLANASGAVSGSSLPGSWGNAVNYLNSVRPYLEGAQQLYAYYVSTDLEKQWELFMLNARERQRLLDEAYAQLESNNFLTPWDIISSRSFQAESPDQYLSRTKNPNPGATANDVIHNFARIALSLPRYPMEQNVIQQMFDGFQQQIGRVQGVA